MYALIPSDEVRRDFKLGTVLRDDNVSITEIYGLPNVALSYRDATRAVT